MYTLLTIKKISYALSFMTEGTAKSWATVHTQATLDNSTFGTYINFIKEFQTTFLNTNSAAKATIWLTTNTHVVTQFA